MLQDEYHKKERIFIIGKTINLTNRLTSYNKSREHSVVYYKSCKCKEDMDNIEKIILKKMNPYRETLNRDRFLLPNNSHQSLFTKIIDDTIENYKKNI